MSRSTSHVPSSTPLDESARAFLRRHLDGVSRTFALTIPQLPDALWPVVANAYLLCRIADTIEDDPGFDQQATAQCSRWFLEALEDAADGTNPDTSDGVHEAASDAALTELSRELQKRMTVASTADEHQLIAELPAVIANYRQYNDEQRDALRECVRVMSGGMAEFQRKVSLDGLDDMAELDRYCYFVAGVVGECLTRLFCEYSPQIAAHRQTMMALAVSFGQGLQMTNILKDVWDDRRRGVCWLPRRLFEERGVDLQDLQAGDCSPPVRQVMEDLLAIAGQHLRNALRYTLLIPVHEKGMRNFCLLAIGMALLTLGKIHRTACFQGGDEVKISRNSVRLTVLLSRLMAGQDWALKLLFRWLMRGFPQVDVEVNSAAVHPPETDRDSKDQNSRHITGSGL